MGIPTLIKTLTADDDSSLSFVDGTSDVTLDSTYDEYMFVFTNINPATDNATFEFNGSTDGGTNYNVTKTTTMFHAFHNEGDSATGLAYENSYDLAQSTSEQVLIAGLGNGSDESGVGIFHLFSPANTTYVTHFHATFNGYLSSDYSHQAFPAGYFNTTSAVDAIQFRMNSGNFDGVIQLFGIS